VSQIALGSDHCLAITFDREVYAWGKGEQGQLGIGRVNEEGYCDRPTRINEIKDAIAIAAGDEHSAAICRLDSDTVNHLWTWGSTHTGKLGIANCHSISSALLPTQVEEFRGLNGADERVSPVSVSCGPFHTALICRDEKAATTRKRVFTFGGGMWGRLGHGTNENEWTPRWVEGLEASARLVVCGCDHTCAITVDAEITDEEQAGSLWVWGRAKQVLEGSDVLEPKRFQHIEGKFVSVACSYMHTFVIASNGDLHAWGDNSYGQLGALVAGEGADDQAPKLTRLPHRPRLLATGPAHTISVLQNKDTYSWGNQRGGRLGLAERTMWKVVDNPSKVDAKWASIEAIGQTEHKTEEGGAGADAGTTEKGEEENAEEENAEVKEARNKEQSLLTWWRERLSGIRGLDAQGLPEKGAHGAAAASGSIRVDAVGEVTGEAQTMRLRGVRTHTFDLRLHLEISLVNFRSAEGVPPQLQPTKGRVELLEFSSAIAKLGKPFRVEVTDLQSSEERDFVMLHFVPKLLSKLNEYIEEFKDEADSKESKTREQPDSNKRMLQAIAAKSTKACRFETMQALLKSEPEDRKMPALKAMEAKLNKELAVYKQMIEELHEKEQKVNQLQSDFEQSFSANLRFIKKLPGPDHGHLAKGAIASKLGHYEELLWVLQQQTFYLATLSTILNPQDEDTFEQAVACIFAEKDNARTLNLFLALLKLIIFKEIEQAKTLKDLFRPQMRESVAFRMLKSLALDKIHYKEVVHPLMKCPDSHTLLGKVAERANRNQVIAYSLEDYRNAPALKDKIKDMDPSEVKSEFTNAIPQVRRFFRQDLLTVLREYAIPHDVLKIFDYAMQEIKQRQFPDAISTDESSAEMAMHMPILYVFVMGILVPILRDPQKYASGEVFLFQAWKETTPEEDVIHHLKKICELLEATMNLDDGVEKEQLLESIARATMPEMRKFLMDQVSDAFDDIDTLLTIDLYISHFDRRHRFVSVSTPVLMKLSNLLRRNLAKLRLNQEDPVDRLCELIGEWSEEAIRAAEANPTIHNLTINTRFLFQEKRMVICGTSKCPVPPRLCAGEGEEGERSSSSMLLAPFRVNQNSKYSSCRSLEELFHELDPLESDTFDRLIKELHQKQEDYKGKSNFSFAQRLGEGIQTVETLKHMGATERDLLEWIANSVNERDRRRRYLEEVKREIASISWAAKRHAREMIEAEEELEQALDMCRNVRLPKSFKEHGNEAGKRLMFDKLSKQLESIPDLSRKGLLNCSYSPMITKSLQQLRRENIVKEVDEQLQGVERSGGSVQITFILVDSGVDITVSVSRVKAGRTVRNNVTYLKITEERLRDLRRAQEETVVGLPADRPLVKFFSANLVAMLYKLSIS